MAILSHKFSVFTDGSITIRLPLTRRYFRVPHDVERVDWNSKNFRYRGDGTYGKPRIVRDRYGNPVLKPFPEVYRLQEDHHTILDCYWQKIWREMNPMLSNDKWSTLLGNGLAITNNTGFPGHRNCITGEDSDKSFPRFDAPRLFGGTTVSGTLSGSRVILHSMNINDSSCTAAEVLEMPWKWFYWTSVNPAGEVNYVRRLGTDGKYHSVKTPFVTAEEVYLPANELHEVNGIADPLTIY